MDTIIPTPDEYYPHMNDEGVYVDNLKTKIKSVKCGCGTRTIFTSNISLKSHFKTNMHREWLILLNLEKENHLKELEKYKTLCVSQQKLIQTQQEILIKNETLIKQLKKKLSLIKTSNTLYELD